MKLYKPFFSIIIIIVQLILSLNDYYKIQEWKRLNPELDSLIDLYRHYETLFIFVLIIGFYEMLNKPSRLKNLIRVFLILIVLGYQLSDYVPISDLKFGVYNTAWFSAIIAFILTLNIIVYRFRNKK